MMMVKPTLSTLNKLASRVHLASNSFGPIHFVLEYFRLHTLDFEHVSHHVGHLVYLHVGHLGGSQKQNWTTPQW